MEQNEKLRALETLQKKLYAYNCASNSLYLDAVTVAPKNTAEGRGVALSILAGELQKLMTAPETLALVEGVQRLPPRGGGATAPMMSGTRPRKKTTLPPSAPFCRSW